MSKIKLFLKKHFFTILSWRNVVQDLNRRYIQPKKRKKYAECPDSVELEMPFDICSYSNVHIGPHVKIRKGFVFLGVKGQLYIKKYSVLAMNCTVIPDGHKPVVGVPRIIAGANHINDKCTDIVIGEDVWVGMNCTILPGANIGRGAIIGACSMVNSEIPPYAIAVGCPARVIASAFTLEEILIHEQPLYSENERYSREELEGIFDRYYADKKSIGEWPKLELDEKAKIAVRISEMRKQG